MGRSYFKIWTAWFWAHCQNILSYVNNILKNLIFIWETFISICPSPLDRAYLGPHWSWNLWGMERNILDGPIYQIWRQSHASNPFIHGPQMKRLYIKKRIWLSIQPSNRFWSMKTRWTPYNSGVLCEWIVRMDHKIGHANIVRDKCVWIFPFLDYSLWTGFHGASWILFSC